MAPQVARPSMLPRTIRNRAATRPGQQRPQPPRSPGSPHQEAASNIVTGRVALGPWGGPFAGHPGGAPADALAALLPSTLFVDTDGAAHLGLSKEEHSMRLAAVSRAQREAGLVSDGADAAALTHVRGTAAAPGMPSAAAAAGTALAASEAAMTAQVAEARAMATWRAHAVPTPGRAPAAPRVLRSCALVRRSGHLNQPRRMN